MKALLLFILLSISTSSYSDYCSTGQIKGHVCEGFIIETCEKFEINAVKNEGKFYTLKKCYDKVSEYRDGLCWIYIKSGGGLFSPGMDEDTLPDFYTYRNKKYTKHEVEYLVFKCDKKVNN